MKIRVSTIGTLAVLLLCVLPGCPGHESGYANGVDDVLYFTEVKAGDFGAVPLDAPWTVTVSHHTSGFEVCQPSLAPHGAAKCSGGSDAERLTIESASCELEGCTVRVVPGGSDIQFSSTAAGTTRVRVKVKNAEGDTYSDAFKVRFAEAKRIELRRKVQHLMALAMPIYKGASFEAARPTFVDADGKALRVEYRFERISWEGKALEPEQEGYSFTAVATGVSTLTWKLNGLRRSVDVEVIEPGGERSLVLLPAIPVRQGANAAESFELAEVTALLEAKPLERIEGRGWYPVHVLLADGRRALAPLTRKEISPAGGVGAAFDSWAVFVYPEEGKDGPRDATLHLGVGTALLDVPVHFP